MGYVPLIFNIKNIELLPGGCVPLHSREVAAYVRPDSHNNMWRLIESLIMWRSGNQLKVNSNRIKQGVMDYDTSDMEALNSDTSTYSI